MTNTNLNLKTSVNGLGAWANSLQAPRQVVTGQSARFTVQFYHQKDGPVNPTGLTATVYQGVIKSLRKVVGTITAPIQDKYGTGSYFVDWQCPATQGSGPVYVEWSGTYQSSDDTTPQPVLEISNTRIVNPSRT